MSCTTPTYSSISLSACNHICQCSSSSSRSLLVWCPGNYSPHLLPPGPKAAQQSTYPTSSLSGVLSPLAWAVTHFLQLQTLSGSLTGSALARSHGWGSFFLTHGLCFTCLQSQNSKSSPSTASLCLQANNCCPSRASFLPLQTGSPSSSIKTALPFCSIKFSCCYTELPLPRLNSI